MGYGVRVSHSHCGCFRCGLPARMGGLLIIQDLPRARAESVAAVLELADPRALPQGGRGDRVPDEPEELTADRGLLDGHCGPGLVAGCLRNREILPPCRQAADQAPHRHLHVPADSARHPVHHHDGEARPHEQLFRTHHRLPVVLDPLRDLDAHWFLPDGPHRGGGGGSRGWGQSVPGVLADLGPDHPSGDRGHRRLHLHQHLQRVPLRAPLHH